MRYAIQGHRPGTTFHVGGRFVATEPVDGGAVFTDAQVEELKKRGYTLEPRAALAPAPVEDAPNLEAQTAIASNKAAAADNNAKVNRAPSKKSMRGDSDDKK